MGLVMAVIEKPIEPNLPKLWSAQSPQSYAAVFMGSEYLLRHGHGGYPSHPTPKPHPIQYTKRPVYVPHPPPVYTERPVYVPTTPAPRVYPSPTYPPRKPYVQPQYPPVEAFYDWEYAVNEHYNDFGHKEGRKGYTTTGKYYVHLPDGRIQ